MGAGEGVLVEARVEVARGGTGVGRNVATSMTTRTERGGAAGGIALTRMRIDPDGVGGIVPEGRRKEEGVADLWKILGVAIDHDHQKVLDAPGDIPRLRKTATSHLTVSVATTRLHVDDPAATMTMTVDMAPMTRRIAVHTNAPAEQLHRVRPHALELYLMVWTMLVHQKRLRGPVAV